MKKKIILLSLLFTAGTAFSQVKVYEGKETIPTHQRADDVLSPVFYTGRGVQGAAGKMYPYPAQNNLGDQVVDVTYNMVYLENEYIRVTVLPSFGGKIYRVVDKTNGYEIIHSNTTIKPDLIGTLGAWVSGGIEWCFPHHHRTSSLLPADYILQENEDGSATVWVGETERTNRLRSIVGITVRPGCSYVELEYRINNTTELTRNFLFWANASMTANKDYRTFWPPSQEIGANHNNSDFIQWPVSTSDYSGTDYSPGTDLTWWKNHPDPKSFFFWQAKEGFIGGYDYGANAGTVHVGDVHENKTSKLFQFGPGTSGQAYRKKLTDDGKAYVELMTGTFSNNQPDYTWFAPHSVKDATNFYYGIRDIEMAKNANIDAAVTLQMRDPKTVFYGFNTTREFKDARITLKYNNEEIVSEIIHIDPASPFTATYSGKAELDEYQLHIRLSDAEGNELISYTPYKHEKPELPEVQEEVKPASEIESVEDLYLAGRFVEQFSRPFHEADDYYLAALEKSPNDYRVNLAMGIRRVNQWRYKEALQYLQRAADKLEVNYYQPKEGELYYYMGLAQKALGMREKAYANLFQSTWYYEWFSAGYYQLAQMEGRAGDYRKALDFVKEAYSTNNNDGRIGLLYGALLRKNGQHKEALTQLDRLIEFDPLNYAAYFEKGLVLGQDLLSEQHDFMSDRENIYLDIVVQYVNAGMYEEGNQVLSSIDQPGSPLVRFYLAWLYNKTDQASKTQEMLDLTRSMSADYCFPFRSESEAILKYAIENDPENAVADYLMGNLLYDNRKEDAILAWENAARIDPGFSMIWRNLAFASFHHENDVEKAIDCQLRALEGDKTQPIWYAELARYYDGSNRDYKECLALLEENIDVVKIDAGAPKEMVKLLNLDGEYTKAIEMLETHHFRTWEGGRIIHSYYVDSHVLRAMERINAGHIDQALEDLEAALLYPANLEVGKPNNDGRGAQIWYTMGQAYDTSGKKKKAKSFYEKAAHTDHAPSELKYFQAMSLLKLGESQIANTLFNQLIDQGKEQIQRGTSVSGIGIDEALSDRRIISNAYYLQALGKMGLGMEAEAKELLKESLEAYPNNLWAKVMLGR